MDIIDDLILELSTKNSAQTESQIINMFESMRHFQDFNFEAQKDLIKKLICKIDLFADKMVIYPANTELSIVVNLEKNGRPAWLNVQKLNLDQERYRELKKELKTDKGGR